MTGVALLLLVGLAPLAACKKAAPPEGPAAVQLLKSPTATAPAAADAAAPAPDATGQTKPATPAPSGPMLAYTYRFIIEAPADGIMGVSKRQEQACVAAGPQVCQVVGSSINRMNNDVSGKLELKATPAWVAAFRGRLDSEVKGEGGKVVSQEVSSEDLSRQIVDTGATLRAKTMLRDRLEKLLAERPGKLSDLLDLEKSIADVQDEIDTTTSELQAMQGRVLMSDLTLEYRSKGAVLGPSASGALGGAFGGFLGNVVTVSALLVTLVSYLLPVAAVVALAAWIVLRIRRKRPAKSPKPSKSA
jgi:hypothetical protein